MKSTKNGIVTLAVVINLQDELVRSKKICWILYQQCDHLVIAQSVPGVVHQKMVCQSKDMPHQGVVLSDPLMILTFMLDK